MSRPEFSINDFAVMDMFADLIGRPETDEIIRRHFPQFARCVQTAFETRAKKVSWQNEIGAIPFELQFDRILRLVTAHYLLDVSRLSIDEKDRIEMTVETIAGKQVFEGENFGKVFLKAVRMGVESED